MTELESPLEAHALTRRFGATEAVSELTLAIPPGSRRFFYPAQTQSPDDGTSLGPCLERDLSPSAGEIW